MPTPIREKIVNNAAPYLRPGEQVQGAFAGQTISGWWSVLTYLFIFWLRYRSVIVTDQRILILDTGKWSMTKPKGVVAELPRNIVIGPASGLWWKCEALGEKLYVHRRFHKDVVAADNALAASGVAPLNRGPQGAPPMPPQGQGQYGGPQQPPPPYGQPPQGQPPQDQGQYGGPQQAPPQGQRGYAPPQQPGVPPQQWGQQPPPQAQQGNPQAAPQGEQPPAQPWAPAEEPDENATRVRPRNPDA